MGCILIVYQQQGFLDVLRAVLRGTHVLQTYRTAQTAFQHLTDFQSYDAVLCGLEQPAQTVEFFSKAAQHCPTARLIPIARTQARVDEFSALWNSAPSRRERNDRFSAEWLPDPCTAGEILALLSEPSALPEAQKLRDPGPAQTMSNPDPGAEVDGYRLVGLIGSGGFGKTWLASNRTTGKFVAFKCVEGEEQLHQELAAMRKYVHVADKDEHLIRVEHINLIGPRLWLVTPLADSITGGYTAAAYKPLSLANYLETRGHLAENAACRVAVGLVQALRALHQAGLMHGDVSPANILSVGGRWLLADPGLVRFVGEPGICRNRVYYPQPAPSRASDDLYAVAMVLWDMTSGLWEMPSGKERLRLDAQMLRFISRQPSVIAKLLCRAAAENLEQRFMVAEEMLKELKATIAKLEDNPALEDTLYHQLETLRTGSTPNHLA